MSRPVNQRRNNARAPVKAVKPSYSRRALKTNPNQVAAYSSKKAYPQIHNLLSPEGSMLVDQVLNPEDTTEVTRWPNTYGMSSVYKCKNVMNARFDEDGRSCVVVAPTIKDCIFATTGSQSSVRLYSYNQVTPSVNPYSFQKITLDEPGISTMWNAPIIFPTGEALLPRPNDATNSLLYTMEFTHSGGLPEDEVLISFAFQGAVVRQASVSILLYGDGLSTLYSSTQAISVIPDTDPFPGQSGVVFRVPSTLPDSAGSISQVRYYRVFMSGQYIPFKGPVLSTISANPSNTGIFNVVLPNKAQHVSIYDIKDAIQLQRSSSQAFILAQSLLLTAEMSDINNGGTLAIARIPANCPMGSNSVSSGQNLTSDTWYDWIASLSNNNYDGPIKDGGYSFYLPEDETGFFYREIDNYFSKELPYLASEFTCTEGLTESSIMRIKVTTLVQFTTTSSIYDQRPSCYIANDKLIHHLLSIVPASYSNESHKESLKRILKIIGMKVKDLAKDPQTYVAAGQILAKLAPAALALL